MTLNVEFPSFFESQVLQSNQWPFDYMSQITPFSLKKSNLNAQDQTRNCKISQHQIRYFLWMQLYMAMD